MTTAASIERELDEGALLRIWVTLCLWGRKYFCLWVFLPLSSNHIPADWMRPHTTRRGVWLCVSMHGLDGMFQTGGGGGGVSFFRRRPEALLETSVWFEQSNKRDQISVFVCADVWSGFRFICRKRRKAASGKWGYSDLVLEWHFSRWYRCLLWSVHLYTVGSCTRSKAVCSRTLCVSEAAWIHLPRQGRLFLRNG